ncbi:MAG: VCBS domain-containing protein [Aliishimia sp.]
MIIFGNFGRNILNGSHRRDWIFGLWGRDTINAGGGNDIVFAGRGKDVINAGSGSDIVFGGRGRDTFVHVVSENIGATDFYLGGGGQDTLELVLTRAQATDPNLLAEIAAFHARPDDQKHLDFTFESLGVTINRVEFIEITITDPGNSAPLVAPLAQTIREDAQTAQFDLLADTSDPDLDTLSAVDVADTLTTQGGRTLVIDVDYTLGIGAQFVTLTAAGVAKFNDLAAGETDQFVLNFGVTDGVETVANTLTLTVTGENDAAQITGDLAKAVQEDVTLVANGLLQVTDPDAGENEVAVQSNQAGDYGLFSITSSGAWTYELSNNSQAVQQLSETDSVTDTFTVSSLDGTSQADVVITIAGSFDAPPNTAPIAMDDSFNGNEDNAISGNVLINDSDPENDAFTAILVEEPTQGTLEFDESGAFTYTPVANFNGDVSFSYKINDGDLDSETAVVTLSLAAVNDDPEIAGALALNALEGGAAQTIDLLSGASDIDTNDVLRVENVTGLTPGVNLLATTLSLNPNDAVFDGLNDGDLSDTLVHYDIVDDNGGVVAQTVRITVDGVTDVMAPDAPTVSIAATDASAPGETQASSVTLIGKTSPGAIVELFEDDGVTSIASVLADTLGEFRITNVELALGTTEFIAIARDPDTGLQSQTNGIAFGRVDPPNDAPANAVLHWIDMALETIAESGTSPDYASRALAMQSIAVENVLSALNGENGYLFNFDTTDADANLAVAYAAHSVLTGLFAGQTPALDEKLTSYVSAASVGVDPSLVTASEALGDTVAARILGFRADDGWDDNEIFIGSDADGAWRPTGPRFLNALNPQWANLDPFTLNSGEQFRPDEPPSLLEDTITDDIYANDLERVRALGAFDSDVRTLDQTQIARFWADGTGTQTPPGHWNRIAKQISEEEGLSLSQSAELMLKLNLALADAAVAATDTKYAYDFWRPVTVLSEGGTDDGTIIAADPDWAPLLLTPAHPEYVSGHSTYSGAAATILTDFFGANYAFSDTAETTSGDITRAFSDFWEAANEGGESRIFGGIHFDFSNETGLELGADVANWVLLTFDPLNDIVAPTITLIGLDADAIGASPIVTGVLTDNLSGALGLRANLDGGLDFADVSVDAFGGFSFDVGALEDGRHTVSFIAEDAAGNFGVANYDFILSTVAPTVMLEADSISASNGILVAGARIAGDVDLPVGVGIAALTVQIDDGMVRPLGFEEDGTFNALLEIGALDPGAHQITLRVADTAGNETITTIDATLDTRPPFQVTNLSPNDRDSDVGATVHPLVQFNREVDVDTLNEDSFYAMTATGMKVAASIVPLIDGTGAWMFFDEPLPGSQAIELVLEGDLIRAADGTTLDGDGDGVDGGQAVQRFTTVTLQGLESTTLVGRVVDPGDDLFMMTPDDFVSGPAGVTDYENHIYRNPIEGAEVYVLGGPDLKVLTDENGVFELSGLPAGRVKIVVEGRTATNAPDDFYWPEMVLDVEIRPGQENTLLGGMGPLEAQLERQDDDAFFLPRIPNAALSAVSNTEVATIKPVSAAGTNLTPEQFDLISLEVQPGSMVDGQGNLIENPQLGLALVPSEMVIDMLPDGVPIPPIFLTIQGPDGGVFTQEAILTIPNVFGLAPGEKTEFFSYDHQTGLLVINGVGTVSEDGSFIQTDPGSGILQPGWNGPIRISRVVIDPQLPCPPGTNHPDNVTPADGDTGFKAGDALNDVAELQRSIEEKYGVIDDDSSFFLTNPAATFFRRAEARISDTLNVLADGYYADDSGPLGGDVDAGFYGIVGTKLVGDIADTFLEAGAYFGPLNGIGAGFAQSSVTAGLKGPLTGFLLNQTQNLTSTVAQNGLPDLSASLDSLREQSNDRAQNGISGKFSSGSPEAEKFEDLTEKIDEAQEKLQILEEKWEDVQEKATIIDEAIETIEDDFGDILEVLEQGLEPSQEQIERLIGPEGTPGVDSTFLDQIEIIANAAADVREAGSVQGILYEIYGILMDIMSENDDLSGELPTTISLSDIQTPASQVEGEFAVSYGPVQYVLMTNLDTGDEQRFTLKSGETPLQATSPGANYLLEIFDPVSGFTGQSSFVAPRPFAINGLTVLSSLPTVKPILQRSQGETVGPGGLTERQADIVGADFDAADSLLPGTNITDRQALISGLGSSPGSINLNGVTGILKLDGTSEAVAIGGTSANGADLRAYVATGDLGLAIVDVTETIQPVLLGQIDLPGFAEDVAVVDRLSLVAVALGEGGLAVIDVRDPIRPQIDAIYEEYTVSQVIAVDDRLVVAQNGRVSLLDVASGVTLTSLGVGVGPEQQFEALAFEDGQIYALGNNGTLHVISLDDDVLNNRGVIDLSADLLDLPESPQIATQDGILWIGSVGTGTGGGVRGGMITVDASDPDALVLVGEINTSNTTSDFAGNSVAVTGSGFGVASHLRFENAQNSESRLTVFDARDPENVDNQVTEYRFSGQTKDIEIAAGEAFLATGSEGLQIVRFLGIDTQGVAPEIGVTTLPEDVDDSVEGLQVFQGQTVRFDVETDDDLQVRSVEVLINGNVILSTVTYPWDLTVTLPSIADLGTDQLEVQFRATDTGGNATITDVVALQMVTDTTPFEVLSISPDDGADLLPGSVRSITVTLSKAVESDTVNTDTFVLMGPEGPIEPASISVRASGTQVQLTYPADVFGSGAYALTIDADTVTDKAGTMLGAVDVVSDFTIQTVSGQTWISSTDGTWNDAVNWSSGHSPVAGDDVVVPILDGVTATISALAPDANSLSVSGGGTLEVKSADSGSELTTDTLSNTGNIDVARGEVIVTTQTANSGNLTASSAPGTTNSGQIFNFGGDINLAGEVINTGVIAAREGGAVLFDTPIIDNQGELQVSVSSDSSISSTMTTTGALTQLMGGGVLRLDTATGTTRTASFGGSVGTAIQGVIDERFVNVDNLITGSGKIGRGFEFENAAAGRIEAQAGDFMHITTGRLDNDGVIEAQSGGTILIRSEQTFFFGGIFAFVNGAAIDNEGGVIRADGGSINLSSSSVSGGVLETINGGLMFVGSVSGNSFPQIRDVTIKGQLIVTEFLQASGFINNEGFLSTSIGEFASEIHLTDYTELTGGGSLNLFSRDVGDEDNEVVSRITNSFELAYDEETGEQLIDEFGQPIVEFEASLTLRDHDINGSGRVGSAGEDSGYELEPLFRISLLEGSHISANQPDEILEFVNVELNVIDGGLSADGGILQFIDSDVYNSGDMSVFQGGEIRMERSFDPTTNGGFLFNSGDIYIDDGDFYSDVFVYNRGTFNVFGGTASVSQMTDDIANGGRTYVGGGQLTIQYGGESGLDTSFGDAEIIIEDTTNLVATLFDFEDGDILHLNDVGSNGPVSVGFIGVGSSGTLTLDDGFSFVELALISSVGDLSSVMQADFLVSESDFGGIQIETLLDFL